MFLSMAAVNPNNARLAASHKTPAPCGGILIPLFQISAMAKVQFSAFITNIKGSIGGTTLMGNGSMHVARNKGHINNFNSARMHAQKVRTAYISGQWRTLTATQLASWDAARSNNLATDPFGSMRAPSTYALFMKVNLKAYQSFGSVVYTPGLAPSWNIGPQYQSMAMVANDPILTWVDSLFETNNLLIYGAPWCSSGRSKPAGNYRYLGTINGGTHGPYNLTSLYHSNFGPPPVGSKLWFKIELIQPGYGNTSAFMLFNLIQT